MIASALSTVAAALAMLAVGCGSAPHSSRLPRRDPATSRSSAPPIPPVARSTSLSLVVRATQTRWRLPAPVYRTVAVAVGRRIFVLGGHDLAGATISSIDELDLATGRAQLAGTLAVPTHGAAAAAPAGRVLVFGGASTAVHDVIQRFDPARHETGVIGRLPGRRADVTAAVAGHTVLLLGGFDGTGPQSDVWASADGGRFHVIAKLPQAVRYPAVVADGEDVYVLGGLISGGEYDGRFSDLIQRVRIDRPSAAVVGRLPTPLAHAMGALIGGRVVVMGGSTPRRTSSAIWRFEPSTGRVVGAGRLPHPLTDAAVATVGDTAYLLGGISGRPQAGVIEIRLVQARAAATRRCAVAPSIAGRIRVASGALALTTGHGSVWVAGFGAVTATFVAAASIDALLAIAARLDRLVPRAGSAGRIR